MTKSLKAICSLVSVILFFLMLGMVVIMNSLVVTRYLFSWSPSWTEEVTRYAMVWMVMLGAAVLVLFEDHITLYLFNEKFSPRTRSILNNCIRLLIAATSALVAWTGYKFSYSMTNILAPGSQMPMAIPTMAIPIGSAMATIFCLYLVWIDLTPKRGSQEDRLPNQKDYMDSSFKSASDEEEKS